VSDEVRVQHSDVLGRPDRPPRRGRRRSASATSRRTRSLVGLALALLVLGAAADRHLADRERAALLADVRDGEQVLAAARDSQLSLAQYAGPLLTGVDVPPAARRSAFATLADDAARWEPRVRARRAQVAAAAVLPWHGELRAAREAYARRLETYAEALDEVERRPQALVDRVGDDVGASRRSARDALLAAGVDAADVRSTLGRGEAR
jgi:hypothetical protein